MSPALNRRELNQVLFIQNHNSVSPISRNRQILDYNQLDVIEET